MKLEIVDDDIFCFQPEGNGSDNNLLKITNKTIHCVSFPQKLSWKFVFE